MIAPKTIKFKAVDRCANFGFFQKILPFKRGSIAPNDLPKKVILQDLESETKYDCELVELVRIENYIPSIFALQSAQMTSEELQAKLKIDFPSLDLNEFAFYLYKINRTL